MRFVLTLIFSLFAVSGCISLTIDQAYAFRTDRVPEDTSDQSRFKMRFEQIFAEPGNFSIEIDANGESALFELRKETFAPSLVTHGRIESADNILGYTLVTRDGPSRPLVVHCGGNATDRYHSGSLYAQKVVNFADILIFDYPGYGDSTGPASIKNFQIMNIQIANFVSQYAYPDQKIVLWGHSLGGFVCTDMVSKFRRVDAIVLETTASNMKDASSALIPWYIKPITRLQIEPSLLAFDIASSLTDFRAPVLVIGAEDDRTLPVKLSDRLAERLINIGLDVTYLRLEDANHISVATSASYEPSMREFFQRF